MLRKGSFIITTLLLVSSVAMATGGGYPYPPTLSGSVSQVQSFSIGDICNTGMASVVALTHGDAGGSVNQSLNVSNIQSSPCFATPCWDIGKKQFGLCLPCDPLCDVEATQTQYADLDQDASAHGSCGIINVNAFMDAGGNQNQFIGNSTSAKLQDQSLGVAAQQVLTRTDGPGGGGATNDAFVTQAQAGSNAAGSVFESSTIDALQTSDTGGAANSTTALAASLTAVTSQAQNVY
jgi:hypothetical protein